VVLMDLRMPRLDGTAATAQIMRAVHPPPAVLVVTTLHADAEVDQALLAGAKGHLLKDAPEERILSSVRSAAAGAMVLDAQVSRRLTQNLGRTSQASPPPPASGELTPRELEVFGLLAQGLTNHAIARTLFLGEATVKTHVGRVLAKLGLESRSEAVVAAYESGLVRPRTTD
jgi:DNA-binding NarL/FixJ family response regulator